jgi:hypothetical protein
MSNPWSRWYAALRHAYTRALAGEDKNMHTLRGSLVTILALAWAAPSQAELISGIEFPQGALSFADAVVSYAPGPGADAAFTSAANSLGLPNVNTSNGLSCFLSPSTSNCLFTSLGNGGSLVLRFTDNVLTGSSPSGSVTGSGDGIADLWVFEVGVAESSNVAISADGSTWFDVGPIVGGGGSSVGVFSYGFDIDKFGFGFGDAFTFVRITDVLVDADTSPAGADIDAVGAISTVPLPASAWFLLTGAAGLLGWRARRR